MRSPSSTTFVRSRSIAQNTRTYDAERVEPKRREALEKLARKPLGKRIDEAVTAVGFVRGRASELARIIGVTPNTVYRMRRGAMAPSVFTLASIARLTGQPMEWFVGGFIAPSAVLVEWRRANPVSDERYAVLEALPLGDIVPSLALYDVANAALDEGLTVEQSVRTAIASTARVRATDA